MKKLVAIFLVLAAMMGAMAFAEDMGVQVIGGPNVETEPVTLDDFKLNADVNVDGYGILNGTSFETVNRIGYYKQGRNSLSYNYGDYYGYSNSGNEADYVVLKMDIINTALTAKNFLENCSVKVVFNEVYEFGGWCHQYNHNNGTWGSTDWYGNDSGKQNKTFYINKADQFVINPMYEGHYCFGCTLPNAVLESDAPLYMIITLDGNEITYNIRK